MGWNAFIYCVCLGSIQRLHLESLAIISWSNHQENRLRYIGVCVIFRRFSGLQMHKSTCELASRVQLYRKPRKANFDTNCNLCVVSIVNSVVKKYDWNYSQHKNVDFYRKGDLYWIGVYSDDVIDKNVEFYKKGDYMIRRDKYLKQLIDSKGNGFPKVITSIRQCGKSFLLKDIYREYLISEGIEEGSIMLLELDDDRIWHRLIKEIMFKCEYASMDAFFGRH